jgi:YVTN family beta-propeller protein
MSGNDTAYISSIRDREIDLVSLKPVLSVKRRIRVKGNPGKMALSADGAQLFVVSDNSDLLTIIDTAENRTTAEIHTGLDAGQRYKWTGNDPNDVTVSPDGRTAYVTNGGTNSIAIISLGGVSHVQALLPTGWFPNAVSVSADGRTLWVANAKTAAGPNPQFHAKVKPTSAAPGAAVELAGTNQYVYQLEKAGLQTIPIPSDAAVLERMTRRVADNNRSDMDARDRAVMQALHRRIHHVIYIIKENRTYDQVLGDLGKGNGDSRLTEFGEAITPNFHALARDFVDLDNFRNSGEVSGDGWPWSTSGRESDFGEKAVPLNYADRGTAYEYEGLNREINVGLPTAQERMAANPKTPPDPDLLPGAVNVAEPDGPAGTPQGKGYI